MFFKSNLIVITTALFLGLVAMPAAAQWADCPSPYDSLGNGCVVNSVNVCEYKSSPTDYVECNGSSIGDTIYLVVEDGNLWAYGSVDGTSFCCDSTELGSTVYPAEFYTGGGSDVICMRDSDLTVNSVTICEDISGSGSEYYPAAADIESGAGNDYISTSPSGNHDDIVDAGGDADYVLTWGGDDTIYGGGGVDYLYGGDHADFVSGDAGADYVYGDDGADVLEGGDDADVIYGNAGADVITGDCASCSSEGGDTIYGGAGVDIIKGDDGNDTIYGGGGDDEICGDLGTDSLFGSDDDDCLCGGTPEVGGNDDGAIDAMNGGADSDLIYWYGSDTYTAGPTFTNSDTCTNCDCEP